MCPICIVAVGSGVGLCRWLGFDDIISGLWIGALILSMIIWTFNWMNKKNIRFKFRNLIIFFAFYFLIIWPLYLKDIMGHPLNTILGIDKILFGIILGTFVLVLSVLFNDWLKKKNNNKVFFPYQKVVIPLVLLIIISWALHYFIGCQIKLPWTI